MKNNAIGTFVVLCLVCKMSNAYEVLTHENMSESALVRSDVAAKGNLLTQLGLDPYASEVKFTDPERPEREKTIKELVRQGARFEDNTPRFFNHFYDPINNRALTYCSPVCEMSPDWALENAQAYSYAQAMGYLYEALTLPTADERSASWGKTFQALGQIIHHIQDMAQPEHVRNDQHLIVVDSSWYEDYSNKKFGKTAGPITGIALTYPTPAFPNARDFWTTRATDAADIQRRGMADFTNRNFVSEDTNFYYNDVGLLTTRDYQLPQPMETNPITSVDITDAKIMGTTAGQALCNKLKQNNAVIFPAGGCVIDFARTEVIDGLNPALNSINTRASSYSVFNKTLTDNGLRIPIHHDDGDYEARGIFTLNRFNYDAAHEYLIPRAVAYSAGLINHFFRGKLQISLPDAGVYGFLDQSTVTGINVDTGFQGFNKIKLKVANITPPLPGESTPEVMNNGTLQAVLKFHRNTCWQYDLSRNQLFLTTEPRAKAHA